MVYKVEHPTFQLWLRKKGTVGMDGVTVIGKSVNFRHGTLKTFCEYYPDDCDIFFYDEGKFEGTNTNYVRALAFKKGDDEEVMEFSQYKALNV